MTRPRGFGRALTKNARAFAEIGVNQHDVRLWLLSRGIDQPHGTLPVSAYIGYCKTHGITIPEHLNGRKA